MLVVIRTDSSDPRFLELVAELDAYLQEKDGPEHSFYAAYNTVESIRQVVVVLLDGDAIGCGAIKLFGPALMEVKRMYVKPGHRGEGVATRILAELEHWALELGARACMLETGKRQTEAVAFYPARGYHIIENYGQYAGKDNSICFRKELIV